MPNTQLTALIESFVAQVQVIAKQEALQDVIAQLGGGGTATTRKRGPGRPKGPGGSGSGMGNGRGIKAVRKGKRRSAEDVAAMGETLVGYVKANPGARADQIASALRTDPGTIRLPMQALLKAKKIKTQGQRRGTKYFVAGAMPGTRGRRGKK